MNDSSLAHNELEIKQVQAEAALCWISVMSEEFYLYLIHSAWYLNRSNLMIDGKIQALVLALNCWSGYAKTLPTVNKNL